MTNSHPYDAKLGYSTQLNC